MADLKGIFQVLIIFVIVVIGVSMSFSDTNTSVVGVATPTTSVSTSEFNVFSFPVKAFTFGNTSYEISKDRKTIYSHSMKQESYQVFLLPSSLNRYKLFFDFVVNKVGPQNWMGFRIMFNNQSNKTTKSNNLTESRNGFYIAFFKNIIYFLSFANGNWHILSSTPWKYEVGNKYHTDLYVDNNRSFFRLFINGKEIMSCHFPAGYWIKGNVGIYTSYAEVTIKNMKIQSISSSQGGKKMKNESSIPISPHYKLLKNPSYLFITGPEYTISFFKNGGIHYIYDQRNKCYALFNPKEYSNFDLVLFDTNSAVSLLNAIKTEGEIDGATITVRQTFNTKIGIVESIYNFNTKRQIISNYITISPLDVVVGKDFSNSFFNIQGILPGIQEKNLWNSNVFGMVYSQAKNIGFNVAYLSNSDFHSIIVDGNSAEIQVQTAGRFLKDHTVKIGTMYFWVSHGDSLKCKSTFWDLFDYLGYKDINPPNINNLRILEVQPGGPITTWFTGIGNFDKLWKYLQPALSIGFNALWVMPSYVFSSSPYNVENFYKISTEYGGNDGYKTFIETAHKNGVSIIQDIVPLGGNIKVKDEDIKRWSRYGRDGYIQISFGHTFNYAAKGWQNYMKNVVEFYTKNFNVDGWRVDVASERGAESFNWNQQYQNNRRASFASLGGDLEMLKTVFDGSKEISNKNPIVLPESYVMTIPEFYKYSNLGYGGGLILNLGQGGEKEGFQSLMESHAVAEKWAYDIQKYLDEEYYSLPKWAYTMRQVANHDTTMKGTFPISVGLASKFYGLNRLKAIMALLTFVKGVPMMYMTDWSDMQNYLKEIFKIRLENPALNDGSAIYDPSYVNASNGVIAFLRKDKSQELLVLVSMNSQSVKSAVYVNPSLYSQNKLRDLINGKIYQVKDGSFSIDIPEFGYKILEFIH